MASWQPGLSTGQAVETGDPVSVLVEHSREASLLVLGPRRRATQWWPGASVARAVIRRAKCPVVVVNEAPEPGGLARRVVLGVDDTEASRGAAEFAFHFAALAGLPVVVVHCSLERLARGSSVLALLSHSDQHGPTEQERLLIAEAVAGLADTYPDVEHRDVHLSSSPADGLVEASRSAQLVVLGARQRHGVQRLLHRSVSTAVVGRAHCPVAVVTAP